MWIPTESRNITHNSIEFLSSVKEVIMLATVSSFTSVWILFPHPCSDGIINCCLSNSHELWCTFYVARDNVLSVTLEQPYCFGGGCFFFAHWCSSSRWKNSRQVEEKKQRLTGSTIDIELQSSLPAPSKTDAHWPQCKPGNQWKRSIVHFQILYAALCMQSLSLLAVLLLCLILLWQNWCSHPHG